MSMLLDGTQGIDFNDGSNQSTAATPYARKNLIINGDMRIAQRSTSATGQSGYIAVDRFRCTGGSDAVDELSLTHAQVTDAPDGFGNSYKVTVSTPETTLAAEEIMRIEHRMEGQNLQHLKKGTSSAEAMTLSFWIKGSVTGTYIVNLHDSDNSRTIAKSYTINSANTWEYKTITFAGDTTGALDNDNAQSLSVYWYLGAGANWTSGTLDTSWSTFTKANVAVGQTDILTTSGATWQITGCQLEVGDAASDFEFVPYDMELVRCQRYYYRVKPLGNAPYAVGHNTSTTESRISIPFPISMRTEPTAIETSGTASDYLILRGAGANSCTAVPTHNTSSTVMAQTTFTVASGNTIGDCVQARNNTNGYLAWSAEL